MDWAGPSNAERSVLQNSWRHPQVTSGCARYIPTDSMSVVESPAVQPACTRATTVEGALNQRASSICSL